MIQIALELLEDGPNALHWNADLEEVRFRSQGLDRFRPFPDQALRHRNGVRVERRHVRSIPPCRLWHMMLQPLSDRFILLSKSPDRLPAEPRMFVERVH